MRTLTKAAVGVGVVLIGAGVWYVNSGEPEGTTGTNQPVADSTQPPTSPAGEEAGSVPQPAEPPTATAAPRSDTGTERSAHEASPAPRNVETGIGRSTADDHGSSRPEPITTPEPPRLTVPIERTGLAGTSFGPEPQEEPDVAPAPEPIEAITDASEPDKTTDAEPLTREEPKEGFALPAPPAPAPAIAERSAPPTPTVATPTSTTKPAVAEARTHVIQSGDTFSSLAVRYYGHAKYASLIVKANPDKDPRRLFVGAKVNIPPAPEGAKAAAEPAKAVESTPTKSVVATPTGKMPPPRADVADRRPSPAAVAASRTYTVQPGEGWYELAQRFLGKGTDWPELYEYNKELVSNNPNLLRAGTTIELPEYAKLPTPQ